MRLISKTATKTSLGCLSKGWYTDGLEGRSVSKLLHVGRLNQW